jgi:hypothetical protein
MVLLTLLAIAAIGALAWLLFTLAVYALPFAGGLFAGTLAYHHGAGLFGAILVGLAAAGLVFGAAHFLLALVRSPVVRAVILVLFAAPAAVAGYYAVFGILRQTHSTPVWVQVFSWVGAAVIGATAWFRFAIIPPVTNGAVAAPRLQMPARMENG